jgi:hypothetical protein
MVKLGFPHAISTVKMRKDAIHIHPTLSNEDNELHILDLIDLNNDTNVEAQIGTSVPNDEPDKCALSFGGKTYNLMESSLANYNIYVERNPKHRHKNGIAAMLTNQEDVCGEAVVVRAKSKGWWWWRRRAKALDPMGFLKELTKLNPNLETLPAVNPPTTKVALSSRKFNSTGDLLNKMRRSRS